MQNISKTLKTNSSLKQKMLTIVTEGEFEQQFLSKLFQIDQQSKTKNFRILSSGGFSASLSKVKTLLSLKDDNIIFLLDADGTTEDKINERKDFVDFYVNAYSYQERLKIIYFVPEFEIIFLNNQEFLSEFSNIILDETLIEIAKFSPKQTLQKVLKMNKNDYLKSLDNPKIRAEFLKDDLIKDITKFIS